MSLTYTSYFGLARISDVGPEIKGWSATYLNPEITALLIRNISQHHHSGSTPIHYPGYNVAAPSTPTYVALVAATPTGGVLSPGTAVGVRVSYLDSLGLETDASPEATLVLASAPARANPPVLSVPYATPLTTGIKGGTYVYSITKANVSGETPTSGVATVDIPFTSDGTSYAIGITFDPISLYSDGTTQLNLYRATGLNADFQLLKSFTDVLAVQYIDDNSIQNSSQAPPVSNTFDKNKAVLINWSGLSHPATAQKLRVYTTQSPTSYNVNNLLGEWSIYDIATPLPSGVYYYGSETLKYGWPKDFSQIPSSPDKLILGTEATGAPILTTSQDFRGYQAKNFVFGDQNTSTPINGNAYVDSSTQQFKVRLNGSYFTLATPNGTFVHSATEPGGHNAQNIVFGSFDLQQVANIIANSSGNIRKQVQTVIAATPSTTSYKTTASSAQPMPEMETLINPYTPDFAGQWVEIKFSGGFFLDPRGSSSITASFQMELNGSVSLGAPTFRSITTAATPTHMPLEITYATPISSPLRVRMLWLTTNGELTSVSSRRLLLVKEIF